MTAVPTNDELLDQVRDVRTRAIEHAREARRLAAERRVLLQALVARGLSQSDIARELGVSRQAVQKMLAM